MLLTSVQSNNIQTTGERGGVEIVESRNMLETGEDTGEGQDVTKSWSSTSSEQEGAIEVREGRGWKQFVKYV